MELKYSVYNSIFIWVHYAIFIRFSAQFMVKPSAQHSADYYKQIMLEIFSQLDEIIDEWPIGQAVRQREKLIKISDTLDHTYGSIT